MTCPRCNQLHRRAQLAEAASGLIACKLPTWDQSKGIGIEVEAFLAAGKPVVYMEPGVVPDFPEALQ